MSKTSRHRREEHDMGCTDPGRDETEPIFGSKPHDFCPPPEIAVSEITDCAKEAAKKVHQAASNCTGEMMAFCFFLLVVILAFFLFSGDPDVTDAIIHWLMKP